MHWQWVRNLLPPLSERVEMSNLVQYWIQQHWQTCFELYKRDTKFNCDFIDISCLDIRSTCQLKFGATIPPYLRRIFWRNSYHTDMYSFWKINTWNIRITWLSYSPVSNDFEHSSEYVGKWVQKSFVSMQYSEPFQLNINVLEITITWLGNIPYVTNTSSCDYLDPLLYTCSSSSWAREAYLCRERSIFLPKMSTLGLVTMSRASSANQEELSH